MTFRLLLLASGLLFLFRVPSRAASADAGQPGGFMRAGIGASSAAMGNAYVALAQGQEAVYWNPAGLALSERPALASTYNVLSLNRQSNDGELLLAWDPAPLSPTAGTFPMALSRGLGAWGVGWLGFSLGDDFEGRTSDTPTYFDFGDHQDEYILGHGRAILPWLAVGAGFELYDHVLENYSAHGQGVDLGALALLGPDLKLGVAASQLFSDFRWSTGYDEQFPAVVRVGLAGTLLQGRLTLAGQAEEIQGQAPDFGLGVEGTLFSHFKLRGGVQQNGFTFGGGADMAYQGMRCSLDYAFIPDPLDQGNEQRFSLDLVF